MRQTDLKCATTGVVIIIIIALVLLGFVRALLIPHKETSLDHNGAPVLSYGVIPEAKKTYAPTLPEQGLLILPSIVESDYETER